MIRVLVYLVIILLGLCLSPFLVGNTGYIYIAAGDYQIETSIVFGVIGLIFFYSLLQLIEWLVVFGLKLIMNSRYLPERWRRHAARKHTLMGALALAEEDWAEAEKAMVKGASKGEIPTLNLLAAARAAQQQHKTAARNSYLEQAAQDPAAVNAVNTTRARYLLQQGELTQARAELDKLAPTSRSKRPVLQLALELYQAQKDWQALKLLLPIIKKRRLLEPAQFEALSNRTNRALLEAAMHDSEQELEKCWHWLSRDERQQGSNLATYALGLSRFERREEALKLLMKRLKAGACSDIFSVLPQIANAHDADIRKQLSAYETKLAQDPDYQICVAKLSHQAREFKQAKAAWQSACNLRPDKDSWLALAQLQEQLGEQQDANQSYRKAANA
ncbi:heme biosynthesis HemY N-terminal domain-containing protein [Shewanella salipaludis]|uniref:Heme biosynthesis protein HemY n=1 Tax=Shewanella salipaludis TaxID=2723052 RepID=A0A972FSY9_9GAMM|nr:heme biosynthesis HemY N-terminal domain-containing protein [Shewanella salipaludis]NMH65156.1 heme biosynthesis protein HemY [Shewanella salipaludis]